jgi:uncharacterized membrane protein YbhN (UPF0104 family)
MAATAGLNKIPRIRVTTGDFHAIGTLPPASGAGVRFTDRPARPAPVPESGGAMTGRQRRIAGPLVSLLLLAGAGILLDRSLQDLRWVELRHALGEFPLRSILIAAALTAASHVALSIHDYIGVRYIKRRIGYPRVLLAAFTAYSISHSLGFPAVTGGTVRYRMYSRWRLSAVEIAEIMAMAAVCMFLGMFEIGGLALLLDGHRVQEWSDLPSFVTNALGVVFLGIVAFYGLIGHIRREPLRIWRYSLAVPSPRFAAVQIAISGIDWLLVSSVLYVLLPPNPIFTFPTFLGVFVLAYLLGTLSNVPGGLGIFEGIIVFSLHNTVPIESIVSSLLVYRAVYHLLPLTVGGTIFLIMEVRRNREATRSGADRAGARSR